jgi:hypothetical protein
LQLAIATKLNHALQGEYLMLVRQSENDEKFMELLKAAAMAKSTALRVRFFRFVSFLVVTNQPPRDL